MPSHSSGWPWSSTCLRSPLWEASLPENRPFWKISSESKTMSFFAAPQFFFWNRDESVCECAIQLSADNYRFVERVCGKRDRVTAWLEHFWKLGKAVQPSKAVRFVLSPPLPSVSDGLHLKSRDLIERTSLLRSFLEAFWWEVQVTFSRYWALIKVSCPYLEFALINNRPNRYKLSWPFEAKIGDF